MSRSSPIAGCRLPIQRQSVAAVSASVEKQKARIKNGFTLIELMMVVAIIGLMMAMSAPAILSIMHEEPMRKATRDVQEILFAARVQAIEHGKTAVVVFHPITKQVELTGNSDLKQSIFRHGQKAVNSTQFDSSVSIADLSINLMDFGASDAAFVRFFPNGTCDEMTLVLQDGDQWRNITLEPTTALASVRNVK